MEYCEKLYNFFSLFVIVLLGYGIYSTFIAPVSYWKKRGVFYVNVYHRMYTLLFSKSSLLEVVRDAYESFPDKRYYGFQFLRPTLFVRDLELIKKITVKDFDHFQDHSTISDRTSDPVVYQNLFTLKGKQWRNMRTTLSPAFTCSKMRQMFTLISHIAERYTQHFTESVEFEAKTFYSKYTNDVIASCAFGIEVDSLKNSSNDFFKMGQFLSGAFRGLAAIRGLLNAFFSEISALLGVRVFPKSVTDFFKRIITETITHRQKEDIVRPDLINLLLQVRKGLLNDDDEADTADFVDSEQTELTDNLITAQALVFFFAGFETSSTFMAFLSYELARNPDIQEKLQREIDNTFELNYDSILNMKYLDQVVCEALRMYPPGFALNRECTKDYVIPAQNPNERDLLIEKGVLVAIPAYGIHMDATFYPNPDKFDPERFSEENKRNLVPGTFMPFGIGPRNCIGARFALMETKALLVSLLSKSSFGLTSRTEIPIKLSKSPVLGPKNGIWLSLNKRYEKVN